MAGETKISIVGNLVADPELRKTQSGVSVVGVTIASTPRTFDKNANEWKDGEATFLRLNIWRELGEHAASSLSKGARVIVTGSLVQRGYEDKDGNKRSSYEIEVDEIGPSLRYATASVQKAQSGQAAQQPARQREEVWTPTEVPAGVAYADETPF